jgi:hypothetical protein
MTKPPRQLADEIASGGGIVCLAQDDVGDQGAGLQAAVSRFLAGEWNPPNGPDFHGARASKGIAPRAMKRPVNVALCLGSRSGAIPVGGLCAEKVAVRLPLQLPFKSPLSAP